MGRLAEAAREGGTVLFVSHNIQAVSALCDRAILLSSGKVAADGDRRAIVSSYLQSSEKSVTKERLAEEIEALPLDSSFRLRSLRLVQNGNDADGCIERESLFQVEIKYAVFEKIVGLLIFLTSMTMKKFYYSGAFMTPTGTPCPLQYPANIQ